jgi:nitrogen-specific signal transduction histidine kinase
MSSQNDHYIVLDNLEEGILHLSNEYVIYANPFVVELLGVSRESIVRSHCKNLKLFYISSQNEKIHFFSLVEETVRDNKKREETLVTGNILCPFCGN